MIDLTPLITLAIAFVAVVIATFAIPWLKRELSAQDMDNLLEWVRIAVAAAQQMYHQLDGTQRKAYVLDFLRSKGFDVDTNEVDAAIEAAVLELHQELRAGDGG